MNLQELDLSELQSVEGGVIGIDDAIAIGVVVGFVAGAYAGWQLYKWITS